MIHLPSVSKKQAEDFKVMREMSGYSLLKQAIEQSIQIKNAELINYPWKFDESGDVSKKSTIGFRDTQKEAELLKKLFVFLEKPVIIAEQKDTEVYEGYEKK